MFFLFFLFFFNCIRVAQLYCLIAQPAIQKEALFLIQTQAVLVNLEHYSLTLLINIITSDPLPDATPQQFIQAQV